jgi:RNA polymerase sigma factor (sigma-70 family)
MSAPATASACRQPRAHQRWRNPLCPCRFASWFRSRRFSTSVSATACADRPRSRLSWRRRSPVDFARLLLGFGRHVLGPQYRQQDRLAGRTRAGYRFILRLVGDAASADDLTSEGFLTVWRHAHKFRGRAAASTWLLAIARFKALDELRRRRDAAPDLERLEASDPAADPEASWGGLCVVLSDELATGATADEAETEMLWGHSQDRARL